MSTDLLADFERALVGRTCTIERRETNWFFHFGESVWVHVEAPWRIIADGRIAYADSDDGQKFGLPEPVEGERLANTLLAKRQVKAVTVDRVTADIRVDFESGTRIEVLNNSSGYEAWQAEFANGNQLISLVGMGGGDIGFSISEGPMRPSIIKMSVLPRS